MLTRIQRMEMICRMAGFIRKIPFEKLKRVDGQSIGKGCCGEVFVWYTFTNMIVMISNYCKCEVAVKTYFENSTNTEQGIWNEFAAMSQLDYASVIHIYGYSLITDEYGLQAKKYALIMEKADIGLDVFLKENNTLTINHYKIMILQIGHGLLCLNRVGLYHGDLKLDNVLLQAMSCKISDLGMAGSFIKDITSLKYGNALQYGFPYLYFESHFSTVSIE